MSDADEANQGLKMHLSTNDYRVLVSWMENPRNFAAIHVKAKKTTIDGDKKKITKLQVFRKMAKHLYRQSKTANLPSIREDHGVVQSGIAPFEGDREVHVGPGEAGALLPAFRTHEGTVWRESVCPAIRPAKRANGQAATTVEDGDEHGDSAIENAENRAASTAESGMATEDDAAVSSSNSSEKVRPQIPFPQAQAIGRRMQVNPARKRKLEVSDRRLKEEEREERERARAFEREQRRLEHEEPQETRDQELLLALINQGKSVEEIREYLKLVGELQASSTPAPDEQA